MGEREPVFLYDPSIQHWDPNQDNLKGETRIFEYGGFQHFSSSVGEYRVLAHTTAHLASVRHIQGVEVQGSDVWPERQSELVYLFNGQCTILVNGIIPGTGVRGNYQLSQGGIWVAKVQEDGFTSKDGLQRLVLGDEEPTPERVEAIIEGYRLQEEARITP